MSSPLLNTFEELKAYLERVAGVCVDKENEGICLSIMSHEKCDITREDLLYYLADAKNVPALDNNVFPPIRWEAYSEHDLCRLYVFISTGVLIYTLPNGQDTWRF